MSNDQNINPKNSVEESEVDLMVLAKPLWNGRKIVIKSALIFALIGLFVAFSSSKEYTAFTVLLPQTKKTYELGGSLGGLAAMAGIDLGSLGSESGISPLLYPKIINSIPFQLELLQTPLTIKGEEESVTYKKYYTDIYRPGLLGYLKKYTIGLPDLILKIFRGKQVDSGHTPILNITLDEQKLIEDLGEQIDIVANKKGGYITLSAKMPEALAAAQLTNNAQQLLQAYITKFKIQKATEQLKFIEDRYSEKQTAFKLLQEKLANFRDRNQNVSTALAQTELQSLQSEYDLAYSVYSELAKKLETQQIQVKEDTPVFTIIQPVAVPVEKSKPKRAVIFIVWTLLGVASGIGLVLGKEYLKEFKKKWNTF